MTMKSLEAELLQWPAKDIANLGSILELESRERVDVQTILHRIKWLYHSRTTVAVQYSIREVTKKWLGPDTTGGDKQTKEDLRTMPDYEDLVRGAARKLDVHEGTPSLEVCEVYISQAVIIEALGKMKPSERVTFFESQIDVPKLISDTGIVKVEVFGPIATMAALGAAQASGFGVYLAATTALGFTTSAIGVTLPFAAYTGLTSTIGFIIGPAGWLAAGAWGTWKLTQPEWKLLIPAVLYIASTRARMALY